MAAAQKAYDKVCKEHDEAYMVLVERAGGEVLTNYRKLAESLTRACKRYGRRGHFSVSRRGELIPDGWMNFSINGAVEEVNIKIPPRTKKIARLAEKRVATWRVLRDLGFERDELTDENIIRDKLTPAQYKTITDIVDSIK